MEIEESFMLEPLFCDYEVCLPSNFTLAAFTIIQHYYIIRMFAGSLNVYRLLYSNVRSSVPSLYSNVRSSVPSIYSNVRSSVPSTLFNRSIRSKQRSNVLLVKFNALSKSGVRFEIQCVEAQLEKNVVTTCNTDATDCLYNKTRSVCNDIRTTSTSSSVPAIVNSEQVNPTTSERTDREKYVSQRKLTNLTRSRPTSRTRRGSGAITTAKATSSKQRRLATSPASSCGIFEEYEIIVTGVQRPTCQAVAAAAVAAAVAAVWTSLPCINGRGEVSRSVFDQRRDFALRFDSSADILCGGARAEATGERRAYCAATTYYSNSTRLRGSSDLTKAYNSIGECGNYLYATRAQLFAHSVRKKTRVLALPARNQYIFFTKITCCGRRDHKKCKKRKSCLCFEEEIREFKKETAYIKWANRNIHPFLDALRLLVLMAQLNLTDGKYSHTLDLHYFHKSEAEIMLVHFLNENEKSNCIQVVTGWGQGSKNGISEIQTLAKEIIEEKDRNKINNSQCSSSSSTKSPIIKGSPSELSLVLPDHVKELSRKVSSRTSFSEALMVSPKDFPPTLLMLALLALRWHSAGSHKIRIARLKQLKYFMCNFKRDCYNHVRYVNVATAAIDLVVPFKTRSLRASRNG
ncbi:unnamed protein product, partial [Trichogramma brassicae]